MQNPASPRTARLINDRAAFDLLLAEGPLTRARLRDLTGLSGPTVAELVARLEAAGLIEPVGHHEERRRGPNAQLYGVIAAHRYAAGVDVSPERVSAAAVDLAGAVVGTAQRDPAGEPHRVVLDAVRSALPGGLDRLAAVVVGVPGLVDPATGDMAYAANLPGWSANVRSGVQAALPDTQVILENEVNLAGVAEQRLGAAAGRDSFALLSLGAGIGVAVILSGQVYRGASGGAGEAGYLPIGPGEFHDLAGGPALLELAREHGAGAQTDPAAAIAAADASLLPRLADRVAVGAAAICALLDPGLLVLGGDVGRAGGAELAGLVQARLTDRVPHRVTVTPAAAPGNPVLQGAHLLGLDIARRAVLGD
ncbi:MAG TPA: ROK family transcriptional regulator [Mycobacteriales bacterium]|nr:ROK family transcriptional regulator [Mycobacteriales bacterium]